MNFINLPRGIPSTHPTIHLFIPHIFMGYPLKRLKRCIQTVMHPDPVPVEFRDWWGIQAGYQEKKMQCDTCCHWGHTGH